MSPPPRRNLLFELTLPLSLFSLYRTRAQRESLNGKFPQHPVVVIPGFGASDRSTSALRGFLRNTGLWVHGWKQGYNHGRIGRLLPNIIQHIIKVSKRHDMPVILIGWSLGGLIAREVARQIPNRIHAICCMGSPLIGGPTHTLYARIYERMGHNLSEISDIIKKREEIPLTVPCHILYSKRDGIVHWEACIDQYNQHTTHQEIKTPHFSMGTSQEVFLAVHQWLTTILPANQDVDQK